MSDGHPLAIITGGTSGIGLAAAVRLSDRYQLALIYSRDGERAALAEKSLGGTAKAFAIDLSSDQAVHDGYPAIVAHFGGPPELLINSAGIRGLAKFFLQGCSLERCQELMNLHFFGTLRMVQKVLPGMYSRRRGCIVNLSSVSARGGYKAVVGYAEAKAAVECFTQNLAVEVAHRGVSVSCVCPGLVETPLTADQVSRLQESSLNFPLGRCIEASEVAEAIDFLVRMGAAVNGQIVTLDGAGSLAKVPLKPATR
ncbi:SDR family oxidoreductase [bacterium]|nr:SDR family oxidoreductase [bacterium]